MSAQTPAAQTAVRTLGDVTAVDVSAKTLQLKAAAGVTWTITLTDKTVCVSVPPGEKDLKKATPIALGDIKPGDRLLARGLPGSDANSLTAASVIVMTKTQLAEKHARDRAEWMHRSVAGTVTAVDQAKNEITISTRSVEGTKSVAIDVSPSTEYRRYASDSVKFSDAKPSSLAEIRPGDQVRALGEKNEDETVVKAEEIVSGSFQTFIATVIAADAAAGTLRVTDLQTNKPVTIRVKDDTLSRRLPEMFAMMLARRIMGGGAPGSGAPGGAPGTGPGGGGQWPRANANGGGPPSSAAAPRGQGGWSRGPGGPGGPGGRQFDMQQMLERMPALNLADLKKGDAVLISSGKGDNPSDVIALTLLAGVEPLLTAAPRMAGGGVNAGSWNLDIGMPGMPGE